MYKCNECNGVFEEFKQVSAESFYGVSDEFSNSYSTVGVCPYCNECDYEELNEEDLNEKEVEY